MIEDRQSSAEKIMFKSGGISSPAKEKLRPERIRPELFYEHYVFRGVFISGSFCFVESFLFLLAVGSPYSFSFRIL